MAKLGRQLPNKVAVRLVGRRGGQPGRLDVVRRLALRRAKADIDLYLNFDMIGSPNYGLFILDGDGSRSGRRGLPRSDDIEALFERFYAGGVRSSARPRPSTVAPTTRRSSGAGIPAGGLFTGAEVPPRPRRRWRVGRDGRRRLRPVLSLGVRHDRQPRRRRARRSIPTPWPMRCSSTPRARGDQPELLHREDRATRSRRRTPRRTGARVPWQSPGDASVGSRPRVRLPARRWIDGRDVRQCGPMGIRAVFYNPSEQREVAAGEPSSPRATRVARCSA